MRSLQRNHAPSGSGQAQEARAGATTIPGPLDIGKMVTAMDPRNLQDDELIAQARDWRQRALRGEKEARGLAHELEREVRRRFPIEKKLHELPPLHLLGTLSQTSPRNWKPW